MHPSHGNRIWWAIAGRLSLRHSKIVYSDCCRRFATATEEAYSELLTSKISRPEEACKVGIRPGLYGMEKDHTREMGKNGKPDGKQPPAGQGQKMARKWIGRVPFSLVLWAIFAPFQPGAVVLHLVSIFSPFSAFGCFHAIQARHDPKSRCREAKIATRQFCRLNYCATAFTAGPILQVEKKALSYGGEGIWEAFKRQFGWA